MVAVVAAQEIQIKEVVVKPVPFLGVSGGGGGGGGCSGRCRMVGR